MGTGGNKPENKLIAGVVDCLNSAIAIADTEFGDGNSEKLRNTQTIGIYYFKCGNMEFEIEIRPRKSK